MAEITIVPLLNAQQISMTGLAHQAAIRPEAAQAIAGELAMALLKQENREVQKPSKSEETGAVNEEHAGSGNAFAGSHRHEPPRQPTEDTEEEHDLGKPLVGNLLNLKV